tara:strand:- start:1278 stop:1883 length:606 start_codon:yes stop_codon:yes gene_type:complete
MVNQQVLVRDKNRTLKRVFLFLGIIIVIGIILLAMFLFGFFTGKTEIILVNPIAEIVLANTNEVGEVNQEAVVEQAVVEFDGDYINYILVAIGVGYLHKSPIPPFENPLIEFDLEGEVWNSEIKGGVPNSQKGEIDNEDLRIVISKEEAVLSLLASNIEQFMKDSVDQKNTDIQMVSGNTELFSKGYLEMYNRLTGGEIPS